MQRKYIPTMYNTIRIMLLSDVFRASAIVCVCVFLSFSALMDGTTRSERDQPRNVVVSLLCYFFFFLFLNNRYDMRKHRGKKNEAQ